jgi:hypothetical protein
LLYLLFPELLQPSDNFLLAFSFFFYINDLICVSS